MDHDGFYRWQGLLEAKERVIRELRPRWAMHCDPDEHRLAPTEMGRLADALAVVEQAGANAVNFQEFTFVPTAEHPDHDRPDFADTMHWYYPFGPRHPFRLTLFRPDHLGEWDLWSSGGHLVRGDDVRRYPVDFPMLHYPVLSAHHMDEKYRDRRYLQAELDRSWHNTRVGLSSERFAPIPEADLRDVRRRGLDATDPERVHRLFAPPPPSAGADTGAP